MIGARRTSSAKNVTNARRYSGDHVGIVTQSLWHNHFRYSTNYVSYWYRESKGNGNRYCKLAVAGLFVLRIFTLYHQHRGNKKKLFKYRARLDVRKYSFSNRVVDLWNSLPDSVISAETVFTFETRLDDYWKDQDILYKYESKINFKLQGNSQDEELVL